MLFLEHYFVGKISDVESWRNCISVASIRISGAFFKKNAKSSLLLQSARDSSSVRNTYSTALTSTATTATTTTIKYEKKKSNMQRMFCRRSINKSCMILSAVIAGLPAGSSSREKPYWRKRHFFSRVLLSSFT